MIILFSLLNNIVRIYVYIILRMYGMMDVLILEWFIYSEYYVDFYYDFVNNIFIHSFFK